MLVFLFFLAFSQYQSTQIESGCISYYNWADIYGNNCGHYLENPHQCSQTLAKNSQEIHATEACCACRNRDCTWTQIPGNYGCLTQTRTGGFITTLEACLNFCTAREDCRFAIWRELYSALSSYSCEYASNCDVTIPNDQTVIYSGDCTSFPIRGEQPLCEDFEWWFDTVNNDCQYYVNNPQYCSSPYAVDPVFGIPALDACCGCVESGSEDSRDISKLICISNRQGLYNETNGQYVREADNIHGLSHWKHVSRDIHIIWDNLVGSWRLTEGTDSTQNVRAECVDELQGCDLRFWEGAWIEDMWTEVEFTKCNDLSLITPTTTIDPTSEYSLVMSSSGCVCKEHSYVNGILSHTGCNVGADGNHEPWCEVTDSNCGTEGRDSCRFCTWFKEANEQLCETELDGNYVGVDTLTECHEVCRRNPGCYFASFGNRFCFFTELCEQKRNNREYSVWRCQETTFVPTTSSPETQSSGYIYIGSSKISVVVMAFIFLAFLFCVLCAVGFWLLGRRKGYWLASNILFEIAMDQDVTLFKDKDGFKVNGSLFNQAREEREIDGTSVVSSFSAGMTSVASTTAMSSKKSLPASQSKPRAVPTLTKGLTQIEDEPARTTAKPLQIKLDPGGARVDFWTEFCSRVPIASIFDVCRQTRGREELTLYEAQQILSFLRGVQPVSILHTDPGLKYLIGRREETLQGLLQNCMPSFVNELKGYGSYSSDENRIPDQVVTSIRKSNISKKKRKTLRSTTDNYSHLTPMDDGEDVENFI